MTLHLRPIHGPQNLALILKRLEVIEDLRREKMRKMAANENAQHWWLKY